MILVTGGAGFIGSALIWALNREGRNDIVVVDHLGLGDKWKNLARRQIDYVVPKDRFASWLADNHEAIEAVFHMGACSATTERDADYLMDNNVLFSRNLWNYCAKHNIPFLYASSAATYGAEEHTFVDSHDTNGSLLPINKYGWSKHLFDAWALKQKKAPPAWYGFKFFNVYGPQEYHKGPQASVVFHAFPQVQSKGRLRLFKSHREDIAHGDQRRDFVYVKDVVNVMIHVWKHWRAIPSGLYNLGTGQARSFQDLGHAVFASLGKEADFDWIDMPASLQKQYQYFTEADLTKLREKTGYDQDFYSLEEGVKDYVQNYLLKEDAFLSD